MKIRAHLLCLFITLIAAVLRSNAQPVLSIDFNERLPNDPATNTYPGFQSFQIGTGSGTAAVTPATTRTYGSMTVTLSGNGSNLTYDDRQRAFPTNTATFSQALLLWDVVFSPDTTVNGGLNVTIDGLLPNQHYAVTIWSYDASSTGNRVSDWTANGVLVKDNYTFAGSSASPVSDSQFQFTFELDTPASGQIAIQGRRDPATSSAGGVFLNALRVTRKDPEPPTIVVDPVGTEVYTGDNVFLTVEAAGTPPLEYFWRKDGAFIDGATNSTLLVSNLQATATYDVQVGNAQGAVDSAPAVITMRPVENLLTGLISYWPLDSLTSITPDVTTNVNDLTPVLMDGSNVKPGQIGGALSFSSSTITQLVSRTYSTNVENTGLPVYQFTSYSVALWVKGIGIGQSDRRVWAEASTNDNNPIVSIGTDNSGTNNEVDIFIRGNGGNPLNHRKSGLIAFDGNWHHIAWVDNNGFASLYVDGVKDQTNYNYTRVGMPVNSLTIGGLVRAATTHTFTGLIDDVAAWRRSLSQEEVQAEMLTGPMYPRIQAISAGFGTVTIRIQTPVPNLSHVVEQRDELGAGDWYAVENVTFIQVSPNVVEATFPAPAPEENQRFYHVIYSLPAP